MKAFDRILERRPPKAASLVVSAFGDAVVPHGGEIWLGSLIRWLVPFGVNDRAVRTAAQRLAADDWFTTRTGGRRSDYLLTPTGRDRFADADRRIYADAPYPWDGSWSIVVIPPTVSGERRDTARRELRWHGFGELAPSVLVHPRADVADLEHALRDLGLDRTALILRARGEREGPAPLHALTDAAWDLRDLAADYAAYVERFRALASELRGATPEPELAFRIRVLAIHEYRRILLRDPELPAELLPESWVGAEARRLCGEIYRRVERAAVGFILATGETTSETMARPLPPPRDFYYRRFGGLSRHREGKNGRRVSFR